MRLGVNALFLEPGMGGLETYVREVVPRLAGMEAVSSVDVVCNPRGAQLLRGEPWAGEVQLVEAPVMGRRGLRAVSELTLVGALASRRFDVLLSPAMTAPLATRAANVVLLADVIWLLFPDLGDGNPVTARLWRALVPAVARRCDRVIALTESAAGELSRFLGVERSRIDVVGLGFDARPAGAVTPENELRGRMAIGDAPVVLNVGAKKVHKNQMRLVEAVATLQSSYPGLQLVLPGAPTAYDEALRRRARELAIPYEVKFPGYVDAADLEGLYRLASCLAFPSLSEGFGLPVLEAMARELPVVCSDASALPEVAGEAAVLVDPNSSSDIARGISAVLADPGLRERLVAAGRERLSRFTWDRCAELTLESLERAIFDRQAAGG